MRARDQRHTYLCAAIGTPLDQNECLHAEGLRTHLEDQAEARVDGVLVAGTMGAMPLLTHRTYEQLVRATVETWSRHGEVLVGVGDLSFERTKERIRFVNELRIDGAVILTPFFLSYSQAELIWYFEALAAESHAPIYLYDLPQRTGITLELETVLTLAQHPNIAGIKCSGDLGQARRLIDALEGSSFRVIVAQAPLIDVLLRAGIGEHVDGVYCLVPQLVRGIFNAAAQADWELAAKRSRALQGLLGLLRKYGVFAATTAILNHRGIAGNFAPRPHQPLSATAIEELLSEPALHEALVLM
ncbi:MAG: dihydrodipicolinate synthase family protein [Burkholderiales bacterium]